MKILTPEKKLIIRNKIREFIIDLKIKYRITQTNIAKELSLSIQHICYYIKYNKNEDLIYIKFINYCRNHENFLHIPLNDIKEFINREGDNIIMNQIHNQNINCNYIIVNL